MDQVNKYASLFDNNGSANMLFNVGLGQEILSLYDGLGFAAGYKILQRIYKFGGQPIVSNAMWNHGAGEWIEKRVGKKHSKPLVQAISGSLIGAGEIIILPLDVLKIKRQTNPEALQGKNLIELLTKDWRSLYKGASWTVARNVPGSFALFGANAFAKEYILGLENYNKATFVQNLFSSSIGGVCSIVVSSPFDVIKTRIQKQNFGATESGSQIVLKMIKQEGFGSFFKGIIPKTAAVAPKLVFSFALAQSLIPYMESIIKV
eukprot:TRINITY_DN11565_c0_g1_i1.p1 TRINITY_DN11565_c0_g1~~TRINITY_DN11565_c0_g1_i1.p1  ORF type:complete len:262 (+),score=24.95 TRINITY_DN11565_c0_g1_i1:257-1042(+)